MKGLLIKDFNLLKNQTRVTIAVMILAIFFLATGTDASFAVSYMTFVFAIFAVSTISYDEQENGIAFLFTLPVTRRTYVKEKYIFTLIATAGVWIVMSVIASLRDGTSQNMVESIAVYASLLGVVLLFLSIMIPMQLKFGAEKSRITIVVLGGIIFVLIYAGSYLLKMLGINANGALDSLLQGSVTGLLIGALVLIIAALFISYQISVMIMEHKEY